MRAQTDSWRETSRRLVLRVQPIRMKATARWGARVCLPADGHGQGLRGAGAGTDDVGPQPFGLKDVEEGVAGGDGP